MIDLPSFSAGAVTSRWPSVRRGSGCGPRLLVPHSTGRSLSRPARTLPCSPDCSREPLRSRALRIPLSSSRATGCFGVSTRPAMSRGRVRPPLAVESRCSAPPLGGTFRRRRSTRQFDGSRARGGCFEHPPRDLRSFTTFALLPQPDGRLQGLVPPTSPACARSVLQLRSTLFLPWVCSPSQVAARTSAAAPLPEELGARRPPIARGPSRSRSPRRPRSRGLLQWSRTVARGRLFEGRGGVPSGVEAGGPVPAWGFVHVKERLSRLRRSSRRPVKEWRLPLSR